MASPTIAGELLHVCLASPSARRQGGDAARTAWLRRWCVLKGGQLLVFADQSAKAPELSLRLRDAMVAATPSGMWSALPRFEGASFQVAEDSSSLVHFFVAASEQLRGRWLSALESTGEAARMEPVGLSRSSHAPLPPGQQQQQQQHHAAAAQQGAGEFDDDDEDYTGPEAESAAFWHDKYTALLRKVKDLESELRALRRNHAETLEELRKAQRAAASREGSSRRLASVSNARDDSEILRSSPTGAGDAEGGSSDEEEAFEQKGEVRVPPSVDSPRQVRSQQSAAAAAGPKRHSAGTTPQSLENFVSQLQAAGIAPSVAPRASEAAVEPIRELGPQAMSVRVFVWSWNMGARSPVDSVRDGVATIPTDYDLYVFGVQECVDERLVELLQAHLAPAGVRRDPMRAQVKGRGDGSFLSPKYTGIDVFVSERVRQHVAVMHVAECDLGITGGSKGAAALALRVMDQTIVFATMHLSAKSVEDRRSNYKELMEALSGGLGHRSFALTHQFHHVVFLGDFNFRLSGIAVEDVLRHIESGNTRALRDARVEQLTAELRAGESFAGFREPSPAEPFYPTYKKLPDRVLPVNTRERGWTTRVYQVLYKEPWYKSGKEKERMPSYCDRVLFASMPSHADKLRPEPRRDAAAALAAATPGGSSGAAAADNYFAFEDHFGGSDHSAVAATFVLDARRPRNAPSGQMLVFTVKLRALRLERVDSNGAVAAVPLDSAKLLFPAPFEAGFDLPHAHDVYAEQIQLGQCKLVWRTVLRFETLHLAIKVRSSGLRSSQCVLAFSLEDFERRSVLTRVAPLRRITSEGSDPGLRANVEVELRLHVRGLTKQAVSVSRTLGPAGGVSALAALASHPGAAPASTLSVAQVPLGRTASGTPTRLSPASGAPKPQQSSATPSAAPAAPASPAAPAAAPAAARTAVTPPAASQDWRVESGASVSPNSDANRSQLLGSGGPLDN